MPKIADLFRGNFAARVGGWLKGIYDAAYAIAKAIINYPDYTPRQLQSAVNSVIKGFSAGQQMDQLQPDQTLWRDDIPIDPTIPMAYQYVVRLTCLNQVSGIESHPTVVVDATQAYTQQEVYDAVDLLWQNQLGQSWFGGYAAESPINQVCGMEVLYVSRRT